MVVVMRLCWTVAVLTLVSLPHASAQDTQIGIIDFYGLSKVSENIAREALTFKEGDTFVFAGDDILDVFLESENRLSMLPGVADARVQSVCCDQGRAIVYVGIEEHGATTLLLRPAPLGDARLAADIMRAGEEFSNALLQAVQRGDADEDRSRGHALAKDATMRAIQTRFISYARRNLSQLRLVLRTSSDAVQRAVAAQVLGYAADKQRVVDDLVYGMSDPSDDVRNSAMRALLVFAEMTPGKGRRIPRIPSQPFVVFLNSPVWSDRNKASGALLALSARRDPQLLASLRKDALAPLAEMARWKSEGHAIPALTILGRIAGYSDGAVTAAWSRGERERIINAALRAR